ncbi:MAG: hypothetical protein LC777_04300, partial [Actinobacteria bacterium]|nr:hypothetical protein [Actinomycetota bacterium]
LKGVAMSALEIRSQLEDLHTERVLAEVEGLSTNTAYMLSLEAEIAAVRAAFVTTAVTEIATLRAELFGTDVG